MSSTNDDTTTDDATDDGFYGLSVSMGIIFVISVIGTYMIARFIDSFCSTPVSEEALARLIARLEERDADNDVNDRKRTIFVEMTKEERQNVLEKVLLRKPYSHDIIHEVQATRVEEGKQLSENNNENESNNTNNNNDTNSTNSTNSNDDPKAGGQKDNNNNGDGANFLSILPMFSQKNKGKKDINYDKNNNDRNDKEQIYTVTTTTAAEKQTAHTNSTMTKKDETQCGICMESYEIGTDVTIGNTCTHMFHTRCILKWMCAKHDFCPFCRNYLFDVKEFRKVAEEDLTQERFVELVQADHPDLIATYMDTNPVDITSEIDITIGEDPDIDRDEDADNIDNDVNSDVNCDVNSDVNNNSNTNDRMVNVTDNEEGETNEITIAAATTATNTNTTTITQTTTA
jgi:hypothetical protein